ncbi:PLP-dependent aminotransferase family protein [Microvirga sp. 3-52]|nr:PLP-dependent aminotransferase family protein [Microvirga sp. 3-52]
MVEWVPKLPSERSGPIYRALTEVIAADIEAGTLTPGTRLPPQRDLAYALGISVGAVTRAYDAAARLGLVSAHVGRGTFVVDRSGGAEPQEGLIDLSTNVAPPVPFDLTAEAVASLRRMSSFANRLSYLPPCGLEVDRRAAAEWLTRTAGFGSLDWRTLMCCGGAQLAMAIAFAELCRPSDMILCEAATFSGARTLAAQQSYRLHGIEMDDEGVRPDVLDRAAEATGARVFYTLPTLHNPTTRTMSAQRRADIVRVARARDLWIVEDDVYAPYASDLGLPPLAALAPERTLYVTSLSKIIAPGLRAGFLVAPAGELFDRCVRTLRALMHSPAGINAAIATDWIRSGRADDLAREVRAEAHARTSMALTSLQGAVAEPNLATGLHLWLPMPIADAERTAARARTAGVRLTPPGAFATSNSHQVTGLRLCVGAAANRATLARALSTLNDALMGETNDPALDPL